jgi:predicted dehydrogenase
MVDLATWLIGSEPSGVRASAESRRRPGDDVLIELIFPGGAVARCRVGYGESTCERLCIEGRSGRLRMANPNMGVHQERGRAASPWATVSDLATLGWRGLFRSRSMSRRSISLVIAAFVDGVRRSVPFSPGFAEAARSSRLLEAAARSLELGTTVDLPLAQARVAHG